MLKQSYLSEHYDLEDRILKYFPQTIKECEQRIVCYEADASLREYLSSVIARLPESNEDYRAIQEQMETIFQQYPKVLEAVDAETATELSQQECAALIKVMELRNNLTDIEMQTVYFRGCYDGVGYLKKAGIL